MTVQKKHKMTKESSLKTRSAVHKADGTNHVLMPSKKGLVFYDVKKDLAQILINTVVKNKQLNSTLILKKPNLYNR